MGSKINEVNFASKSEFKLNIGEFAEAEIDAGVYFSGRIFTYVVSIYRDMSLDVFWPRI